MDVFKNIGLIGRKGSPLVARTLAKLVKLLQAHHYQVIIEAESASLLPNHGLQECRSKMLGEIVDLVIVVGGDGSLLGAARNLARYGTPVLGINRGNLGFLTDISPSEMEEKVLQVLAGEYHEELRFLLDAEIRRKKLAISEGSALNDVVLHAGDRLHMIEFELYIDGKFVYSQRSDGLIICTPTGSTAYALSGGGPIMHPSLDAIALVPMHPHTLSSRPIVVNGNTEIKIIVTSQDMQPLVSCDGQPGVATEFEDVVYVRKKPHKLKLLHPLDHDFYEACRSKLGWGSKL